MSSQLPSGLLGRFGGGRPQLFGQDGHPLHVGESVELLETYFDPGCGAYWVHLSRDCPVKFTPELVAALRSGQEAVRDRILGESQTDDVPRLRYQVLGSRIPGVFNLGGDLALFRRAIREQDRHLLMRYARECVDLVYTNASSYNLPVTTISLVQGSAMGGGFEAALAADVVVAEEGCRMGLPEVLFNMFPGMGAYQLLARRLPSAKAESLIMSGRTWTAEELHGMGVIDILAEPGEGEQAVMDYISRNERHRHGRDGFRRAVRMVAGLDYEDMVRVAGVWVDTAMELSESDLRAMEYLLRAQSRYEGQGSTGEIRESSPGE